MKANERRKSIAALLLSEKKAIPGAELARRFKVSRQIIVRDISTLKSEGYEILATHFGYVMQKSPLAERVFKVTHTAAETEDELNTIVELGGIVADVYIWHKVYGKIAAPLNIFTKEHVKQFLADMGHGKSGELLSVTGGLHYHTVRAETEEILDRITQELAGRGYLVPEIR